MFLFRQVRELRPESNLYHQQAKKGGFKDTHPELLLSHVLRATYERVGLDPALIEDISVGNVLPPGGGASMARMAALHAGIPNTTSLNTVNRQCSSGLTAVNQIANQIIAGQIDIGIGKPASTFSVSEQVSEFQWHLTIRRWLRVHDIRLWS